MKRDLDQVSWKRQLTLSGKTEIWVQGMEENNQWKFHDGTLMSRICLAGETNGESEIHMRANTTCPTGYVVYHHTYIDICLLYVPIKAKYTIASSHCKQNGGDLIKIDTLEKYDFFKYYLGQYTGNGQFQVLVQEIEENNTQWRFHDGTLMPGHCLASLSGLEGKIHMRAMSSLDFKCQDAYPTDKYHFMC
ncbi:uncharacterized protein LOC134231215 [Saccostrea cucullata]|uniref:uncharacterized protein LOC134231215 n=1 Tax=Saccostrea cuccullata TaxID=36930 RepID=UPI002ED23A31